MRDPSHPGLASLHLLRALEHSGIVPDKDKTYKVVSQHELESHTFRVSVQGVIYFIY